MNIGRIKLSAASIGACKAIVGRSVRYANERQQFGRPIAKYGAIRYKLAEQVVRTFACESATYRASQNITDAIEARKAAGMSPQQAELKGVEEFAIECAMMKVHGSETLDYVVDEGVQIFGGMGYSAEAPMDRAYRDARINRIFEGTNEINRLLTVDMMLKRAMKGSLDLMGPAQRVAAELLEIPDFSEPNLQQPLEAFHLYTEKFKKAVLLVAGAAVQKLMMELAKEQEILMDIADMAIETYVAESTLLRVQKLIDRDGIEAHTSKIQLLNVLFYDTADRLWLSGKNALCSFGSGDELSMTIMGLKRFTKTAPISPRDARRAIAAEILEKNAYPY